MGMSATANPCDSTARWYGVGFMDPCDAYRDGETCRAGRITGLNLGSNNLTGAINDFRKIGDLTNLTFLDFSNNSIGGNLPTQIGRINNVEIIDLSRNSISGSLPEE